MGESNTTETSPYPTPTETVGSTPSSTINSTSVELTSSQSDPTTSAVLVTTPAATTGLYTTPPPVGRGTNVPLYVGVAAACAVALVITLILFVFCIVIWRRKFRELEMTTAGVSEAPVAMAECSSETHERDSMLEEMERLLHEEEEKRRAPVLISEFSEYVRKKHQNSNIEFEEEFRFLPTKHSAKYGIAKTKQNDPKNRFENIFPYDLSRVVLRQLEDGSDYINASYINGYNRENAYIAAQGPLRNTIGDFWRMVWEFKLTAIIMLTETVEAGRDKCAQYWPALLDTPWFVGNDLSVTLECQTQYAAYRVKSILLQNSAEEDSLPHRVTHFHFSAWPDHGVPADKTCLIQFIQRVRKDFPYYDSPPLVVHCSAGVGRSGTFIVLDSMLERMKVEESLDIFAFICEMRKKRVLMVQTEAQYSFIHDALEEYLTIGDTSFAVTNTRVTMVNLSKCNETSASGYHIQFELLDDVSQKKTVVNCSEAEMNYNEGKNRYNDYVPYNVNRVFLRSGGVKGADYINASFIDGYKHRKHFIATQCPVEKTVNDFWRMVWQQKSHVIVMLCNFEEEDREESDHPYWPQDVDRTTVYGKLKVKLLQEEEGENIVVRKFELGEDSPYMAPGAPEAVVVTQFQHVKWPERGALPSSESILEIISSLLKIQMSTGNRAIVVMCNNGVGRTGAFTTIFSQIERVKAEQVADIFQCIKSSRIQRPEMVIEESHFRFCHQVLADYLDSVDNYANFKDL